MRNKSPLSISRFLLALMMAVLACNLPFITSPPSQAPDVPPALVTVPTTSADTPTASTPTVAVAHLMRPSDTAPIQGSFVYDVDTTGTGPEGRAPYGDSYKINRLERPFEQNMTYVPDLDIVTFNLNKDTNWYYISIQLSGTNPNDSHDIDYGVEIDLNHDGFGDYLVWAHPPYTSAWDASNVKVFKDTNHDTGGLSGEQSDAPFNGNGYDKIIFDGGQGDDPDLAWVRIGVGQYATVQFAIKKLLPCSSFMMGVWADAGLKDATKFDYNDRFTEEQAGSPERNEKYYPLKALFAVDNTCWEAFGFKATGYEPKLCPREEPKPGTKTSCQDPQQYYVDQAGCIAAGCRWCTYATGGMGCEIPHCTAP